MNTVKTLDIAPTASPGAERPDTQDLSVLLLLPIGSDSALAYRLLVEADFYTEVRHNVEEICQGIQSGAGAVVLGEEVLTPPALDQLSYELSQQPPWSDIPLIILLSGKRSGLDSSAIHRGWDRLGNATFLERPLRIATLLQSIKVALASRKRQYEAREYLREREQAGAERLALLERQRRFLRDVLLSVTEGRLHLCDSPSDLPERFSTTSSAVVLTARSLKEFRQQVLQATETLGFSTERAEDFVTGVSEAAMNAVVHAGGGIGTVGVSPKGMVQVWIEDQGTGIDMERLPRATLERGFSSAGTLGHGFWLLLKYCECVYLLTGLGGTTVVLEQKKEPEQPDWIDNLPVEP